MSFFSRLFGTERWPSILSGKTRQGTWSEVLPALPGMDFPLSVAPLLERPIRTFTGWRQQHVDAAVDAFDRGEMHLPHKMWLAMQKDAIISHGVETRVTALVDCEFEWRKPKDLPQALFDEWIARWPECFDEDSLATTLRDRIGLGVVPSQCIWTIGKQAYWLRRIKPFQTGNVVYDEASRCYKIDTEEETYWLIDDCDPWVLFRERASHCPHLYGAARALSSDWWLSQEAIRLEALYGRRCGNPIWKVTAPIEQRAPTDGNAEQKGDRNDFQRLLQKTQRMLGNGVFEAFKFPPSWDVGYDLDFVESEGLAHKVFDVIIDRTDERKTLKLLGAVDNTRGGRDGSRARALVHEKKSSMYTGADGALTMRTMNRIARKWCEFNRFPVQWAPLAFFDTNPPEDHAQLADVRQKYAAAIGVLSDKLEVLDAKLQKQYPGSKVDYRKLLAAHQIPLSEPGEESPVEI